MDARIRARRAQVVRQRLRRRRRVTLSVVGLLLLAVAAVAVARSPLFAIAEVRVLGVAGEAQAAVREEAGLRPGDNLLAADLRDAADRVEALPWVHTAGARRLPPSTVEVRVVVRQPVMVIRLPDAAWLVDAGGVVVAGGSRPGLPEVLAPHSVVPGVGGEVRDAALRNALDARARLPVDLRAVIERYEAPSARDLRLRLRGGVVVRFGAAEDVEAKARSVLLLLEQARVQAGRREPGTGGERRLGVAEIDVRAPDNPVIVPVDGAA